MQQSDLSQLHTPQRRHIAFFNFLMNGPILKLFGMKIGIDTQEKNYIYTFAKSSIFLYRVPRLLK